MDTWVLLICIVAVATMFYARSAFRQGNLQGAKLASLACIAACSVVAAANAVRFIQGGGVFDIVFALIWAWLAYRELADLGRYNTPPPGTGKDDQDQSKGQ